MKGNRYKESLRYNWCQRIKLNWLVPNRFFTHGCFAQCEESILWDDAKAFDIDFKVCSWFKSVGPRKQIFKVLYFVFQNKKFAPAFKRGLPLFKAGARFTSLESRSKLNLAWLFKLYLWPKELLQKSWNEIWKIQPSVVFSIGLICVRLSHKNSVMSHCEWQRSIALRKLRVNLWLEVGHEIGNNTRILFASSHVRIKKLVQNKF